MKKNGLITLSALVLISLLSAHAFATSTRDKGMGLFEYPWFIDGLQSYIYENPAHLSDFKNRITAERIGAVDGTNMGGIIDKPLSQLTYSLHFGYPTNNSVWNTTAVDGLFNVDNYSMKGVSKFTHPGAGQSFTGYQVETLKGLEVLDLTDPVDATSLVGSSTISPTIRKPLTQKNLSAMVAYNFAAWTLGVDFGYATSWVRKISSDTANSISEEYNLINTEYSSKIGAAIPLNNKVSLDYVVNWTMYILDNNYNKSEPGIETDMTYGSALAMDVGSSLVVNYQMTQLHKMHFKIGYTFLNRSTEGSMTIVDTAGTDDVDATDTFSRLGHQIELGVSDEFLMNKNLRAFLGLDAQFKIFKNDYSGTDAITAANNPDKYTNEYMAIKVPLIIGLEGNITENLTGRLGLVQTIYAPITYEGTNITGSASGTSTTLPTSFNENSSPTTTFNLGLSYKHDNFSFDWLGNVEMLTSGPNLLSGKQKDMAMAFAVTYNYNIKDIGTAADPEKLSDSKDAKKAEVVEPKKTEVKTPKKKTTAPVTK